MQPAVVYFRVSTARQGRSGLGLEAQRAAVSTYLCGAAPVAEFIEIESGKSDVNRPRLQEALAACRLRGARLVIAKLDRLSRDAHFLLGLQKARVPFTAADVPDANELTIGILAVLAQHERQMISRRTREALAARRARGLPLGHLATLSDEGRRVGSPIGNSAKTAAASARAADFIPVLQRLRCAGAKSLRALAAGLTLEGLPAPRGGAWSATQVRRVMLAAV